MASLPTVSDYARTFLTMEPSGLEGYVDGGSGRGITLERNTQAWDAIELLPHSLHAGGEVDMSVEVLGVSEALPFMIAPVGFQEYVYPKGGLLVPQAAAATGTRYIHSTFATSGFKDLEGIPNLRWWFQLYAFNDSGLNRALIERAIQAGASAIVFTVDLAALGVRERDVHSGFTLRGGKVVPCLADVGAEDPRLAPSWQALDHNLTWDTLREVVGWSTVPVLVKGILRGDDARHCIENGAAGVVVSNHGGRQLDTAAPTASILASVVDAVNGSGTVLVDSGIRSGLDIAKALALGADAALIGRPILWGLGVAGQEGVANVIELLRADFERSLILIGVRDAKQLSRSVIYSHSS